MISFNHLGNLGRLANQMFQYAAVKGIAANNGYKFSIPPKEVFGTIDSQVRRSDVTLYDVFDLESKNILGMTQYPVRKEHGFEFDSDQFSNCQDNVDLLGYYQSEKYFKHIENQIREDFTFKSDLLSQCREFFYSNFEDKKVISLHVRRTDYTKNPHHPPQEISYYEEALKYFDSNLPVIVFSDDPTWCSEQQIFADDRFAIAEGNSTDCDLCLMSLCNYHIIANSSFSWWGAWLAKSEKVIAPKKWFGGTKINYIMDDLYCSDWIIL